MRWAGLAGSPDAPTTAMVSVSAKIRASRSRRDASIAVASAPQRGQRPAQCRRGRQRRAGLGTGRRATPQPGAERRWPGGRPMSVQATDGGRLGPRERQAALDRMAEEVMDVVVVGGGVTGGGPGLD